MLSALQLLSYLIVALCVSAMLLIRPEEVAHSSLPPPPLGIYYFRPNETLRVLEYGNAESWRHKLLLDFMSMKKSHNRIYATSNTTYYSTEINSNSNYYSSNNKEYCDGNNESIVCDVTLSSCVHDNSANISNTVIDTAITTIPATTTTTFELGTNVSINALTRYTHALSLLDDFRKNNSNINNKNNNNYFNKNSRQNRDVTSLFSEFTAPYVQSNKAIQNAITRPVQSEEIKNIALSELLRWLEAIRRQEQRQQQQQHKKQGMEYSEFETALRKLMKLPLQVHVIAAAHGVSDILLHDNNGNSKRINVNNYVEGNNREQDYSSMSSLFNDLTFIHAAMLHKTHLTIPHCESVTLGFLVKHTRDAITQILEIDKPQYIPILAVSTGDLMNSISLCLASLVDYSLENLYHGNNTRGCTNDHKNEQLEEEEEEEEEEQELLKELKENEMEEDAYSASSLLLFSLQSITFIGTAQVSPVVGGGGWRVQSRSRDKIAEYVQMIQEKDKFEQTLRGDTFTLETNEHAIEEVNDKINEKKKQKRSIYDANLVQSEDVDEFINPSCQHEMFITPNVMRSYSPLLQYYEEELEEREEQLEKETERWRWEKRMAQMPSRLVNESKKIALGSVCVTDMAILGECGFCSEDSPVTSLCSRPRCHSHTSTTFFGKCVYVNEWQSKQESSLSSSSSSSILSSSPHMMAARMKGAILRSTLPPIPLRVKEGMQQYWSSFEALEEYVPVITHSQASSTLEREEHHSSFIYKFQLLGLRAFTKIISHIWYGRNNNIINSNYKSNFDYSNNDKNSYINHNTTTEKTNTLYKNKTEESRSHLMYEYNRIAPSAPTVLNCAEVSSHEVKYSIREDALCREYVKKAYDLAATLFWETAESKHKSSQTQELQELEQQEQHKEHRHRNRMLTSDDVSCVRGREGVALLHFAHKLNSDAQEKEESNNGNKHVTPSRSSFSSSQSITEQTNKQKRPIPVVIVRGASSYTTLPLEKVKYHRATVKMQTRHSILQELEHSKNKNVSLVNAKSWQQVEQYDKDDEYVQWTQPAPLSETSSHFDNTEMSVLDENVLNELLSPEFARASYQYAIETASAVVLNYFLTEEFN